MTSRRPAWKRSCRLKISAARAVAALALAGTALAAIPAIGQDRGQDRSQDRGRSGQDAPESLLPPGFGDPDDTPAPPPSSATPTPTPTPSQGANTAPPRSVGELLDRLAAGDESTDPAAKDGDEEQAAQAPKYDLDPGQRRSLARVGWIGPDEGGVAPDAWGRAHGRFLSTVMRRIDAPIASRWLSIALRRTLMSATDTPVGVNGADFAAERAWLLLRMGEAAPARAMVQAVDVDNTTPKLATVAMQAALANADPAAMCPIAESVQVASTEASWELARAMCAGLVGDAGSAGSLIEQARRHRKSGSPIDVQLAEKVVGAGANSRRAVTIEWEQVQQLTAWRYGLATATGVSIPEPLFATVGPHVQAWRVQAPMLDASQRAAAAAMGAALGVLSNLAYVDLVSAAEASDDATPQESALAGDLRDAYTAGSANDRLEALQRIWGGAEQPAARYARAVLTARAAARVPADADRAGDADRIVGALLAGGLDTTAMRWASVVPADGNAWAMLALADPRPRAPIGQGAVEDYADAAGEPGRQRAALLLAGLAGLGRMSPEEASGAAQSLGVPLGRETAWTRAIDAAAARGEPATVVLLAAAGMQTTEWKAVPAFALFRICNALRRVGMEGYARMIAAEAVART